MFVNGGEVLSFWDEGEVAGGPLTGDYFTPRLEPSGDGIFWSSSEMTVYGPTDDDGLTDGEHLTLAEAPSGGACVDPPGVATSPDEKSVLVATSACDADGASVIRRFDCVE